MAVRLTNIWDQHAFPDDYPAKETQWAEQAEHRRADSRHDFYLEQSGSDLKIRRHTSSRNDDVNGRSAKGRAADDMMMLAVGSPAWQAAYDSPLSFTVDGEDIDITQGELHDLAKRRADDLQRQIETARRQGLDPVEIAALQASREQVVIVRDNTDPALGEMDEERHRRVQDALTHPDHDPVLRDQMKSENRFRNDPDNDKSQAADTSVRVDQDRETWALEQRWTGNESRGSFAAAIDDAADNSAAPSLAAQFTPAAANLPPSETPETTTPAPDRTAGLDL